METGKSTSLKAPKLPSLGPLCTLKCQNHHSGPRTPKYGNFTLVSGSTHALSPSISLNSPYNGASWEKWRFVWSGCGRSVPRANARTRGAGSPACRCPPGARKHRKTPLPMPPNYHPGPTVVRGLIGINRKVVRDVITTNSIKIVCNLKHGSSAPISAGKC